MNLVIPANKFNQMQAIPALPANEKERKEYKYSTLDRIKSNVKRNWKTAKKLTGVLDEIIYKATDRGYSFNGRETLAKLCKCGLSTVDEAVKVLKESGEVMVGYRENPNSNGYKTPVIFFKNHPNFHKLNEVLGLEKYIDQKVNQKVENAETPCDTKDEQPKKVPTYSLPELNNNHLNNRRSPYIKLVPKSLQHFQTYFGKDVKKLYGRVWLAVKNLGVSVDREVIQSIGFTALNQLKKYVKEGKQLSKEALCILAYKISYNQLKQGVESGEILDANRLLDTARKVKERQFQQSQQQQRQPKRPVPFYNWLEQ